MELSDMVESPSLQIQFVAIKSLPNQTTPDLMGSSQVLEGYQYGLAGFL